jgi:tetratricopeptide (TPR) repeat protein
MGAGAWKQAADYHRQAGDQARAVYANAEAAAHYSQALQALERLPGTENLLLRFQLHLDREAAYKFLGRRDAQAEDLTALTALVKELDDEAQEAQVLLRQGMYADTSGDFPVAIKAAQQAVRLARAAGDVQLEAEAQRQWGRAFTRQGNFQDARPRLEAALDLAQRHSLPVVEAASLVDLGTIAGRQGDYERASRRYEQALGLLRQTGDRQGEAAVLNNLGLVARLQEDYAGARAFHEQSVHVRREIGDWQGELRALNNLAIICRHQGDYARARLYFEQVLAFQQEIGERLYESLALNNLGMTLLNLGDYADAGACFEQSLRISREIGNWKGEVLALEGLSRILCHRGDEQAAHEYLLTALRLARDFDRSSQQSVLTGLGRALTGLDRLAEAADAYHQALALQRELGRQNMTMESLAGLARLCLAQGSLARARDHVAEILAYLDGGGSLDGTEEPGFIFLTCYQVLQTLQDSRAGAILDMGYRLLQERAAWIEDEATRRSFLENVAAHRAIVAAYRELQGRRITARLPRADAPTGRPLRDDEYVTIAWTVDAPGDAALHKKVARRRCRLLRLLKEAQAQGAAPTHAHLAQALGVSQRTIERDVAALRQEHPHLASTRGVMCKA